MAGRLPELSRRDLIQTAIAGTGMLIVAMAVPAEASAKHHTPVHVDRFLTPAELPNRF